VWIRGALLTAFLLGLAGFVSAVRDDRPVLAGTAVALAHAALAGYAALTSALTGRRRWPLALGVLLVGLVLGATWWTASPSGWFAYSALDPAEMARQFEDRALVRQRVLSIGQLAALICLAAALGRPRLRWHWLAAATLAAATLAAGGWAVHRVVATVFELDATRRESAGRTTGGGADLSPMVWSYLATWLYLAAAIVAVAAVVVAGQRGRGGWLAALGAGLLALASLAAARDAAYYPQRWASKGNVPAVVLEQTPTSPLTPLFEAPIGGAMLGTALFVAGCLWLGRRGPAMEAGRVTAAT